MNILYVTKAMGIGGVQKCILQLSKYFVDTNKIVVASGYGDLVGDLDKLNIKHYGLSDIENKSIPNILKNILTIAKIVKNEKIDVIHSHHRMTTLYAKILSKFIKVKVIHTQHLCIEDKFKLTTKTLKDIDVITVSDGAKEILVKECGLDEKKITTIYNTIDTECTDTTDNTLLKDLKTQGKFVVAQINRLVDYKGVYDYLEAAKAVIEKEKDIVFVVIGDGPEKDKMMEFINNNNLNDNILMLGKVHNVINQFKYIDLVVLSSYIEGLPLVPLEAFSQGVPVVGTDIPGTNEEIINGVNGYLVKKGDFNEIAQRIIELYNNKETMKRYEQNAVNTFNEKFNLEKFNNNHEQFYLKIMNEI